MMHSNTLNYEPASGSSSSSPNTRIARTSLVLSWNGEAHDLSILCWKTQCSSQSVLYPSKRQARQLPEIDEQHALKLWEPIPRSEAPFRRSYTADAAMSSSSSSHSSSRQQSPSAPGPLSPCPFPTMSSSSQPQEEEDEPSPRPFDMQNISPCSSPAPTPSNNNNNNNSRQNLNQPGPRPKVDYKRLYHPQGEEGEDLNDSRRSLNSANSSRHISFQEQQLQRTLEEERRINSDGKDCMYHQEPVEPSYPSPMEPSYPMPSPVEPSYPMPCPFDMPQQQEEQPVYEPEPIMEKQPYKSSEKESYRCDRRQRSPPLPTAASGSKTVMEIAPNMFVPYKGSHETWEAVQMGHFTVTTCFACALQLVVIDTAEFLVCPDCHTVSPLSYSDSSQVERCGVGLGIKREWCDTEGALVMGEQQQQQSSYHSNDMPSMQSYPDEEDRMHQKAMKEEEKFSSSQHFEPHHHQPMGRRATFMI